MGYNAYVKLISKGFVWGDEFMLEAIGYMFNIETTVISPFYNYV